MSELADEGCCACHVSPPCAYCTNTFECEDCKERFNMEGNETPGWEDCLCDDCYRGDTQEDN